MPFQRGRTPPRLKNRGIPQSFIDQFTHAWNSVYARTSSESKAYQQAYGVMRRALIKAGYSKGKDNKWHKVVGEEIMIKEDMHMDKHEGMQMLAASSRPMAVVERMEDGGLKFEGVALIDEAISQGGRGRYYSAGFNDRAMAATNLYMEHDGTVTIYSRHGKAVGEDGRARFPTGLPVGKVMEKLFRKGKEIRYIGFIAPTAEGRDVITLVETGVLSASSIRSTQFTSRKRTMDGVAIDEMLTAVINGIDLCDEAGIAGAGIKRILEGTPNWTESEEEEEDDMGIEYADLTLELLAENRKDLMDGFAATVLEAHTDELTPLQEQVTTLTGERDTAVARVTVLETEAGASALDLAIEQAAQMGIGKLVAERLRAKTPATVEEVTEMLPGIREEAMAVILSKSPGSGDPKGKQHGKDIEDPGKPKTLTEEQEAILHLA